jgi:aminotransferase
MAAGTLNSEEELAISRFKPAERLKGMKAGGISRVFDLAKELPNCINLSLGEPDFCVSRGALERGWNAAVEGKTHYAPTNGVEELREALAEKVRRDYGLNYDPNCEVLVTVGGSEAIALAFLGLLNPCEEVMIPNPGFVGYEPGVLLAGGATVDIPLLEKNDFSPSARDVTSLVTDKSRVMLLNFPNNPTGAVLSHDQAGSIAKIAVDRDMIVISDEVYEKIVYDDARHHCMATFPGMRERTLVINSFSKTYAMTGIRVGFVYGPKELIAPLWLVHQYTVTCVDSIAQYIALAALTGPQDFVKELMKEFDRRRHLVHKRLNEIEGFSCILPKGAFYAFPNITAFGLSSEAFAQLLLREAQVMTMPGSAYGKYGEGYIRISYAAAYEKLEEALDRIEKAVRKIR